MTAGTKLGDTVAVRLTGSGAVELGYRDVGDLLRQPDWVARAAVDGPEHRLEGLRYAPVIAAPEKIICVGLNYRPHILEMGRELPSHPTLFAKFARALVGADDDIERPRETHALDWEAELAVVIGAPVRRSDPAAAAAAIAGYAVLNDVTARDWQYRTQQWLSGKTFEATTPLGPWLLVGPEPAGGFDLTCEVDGEVVQQATTRDLLFSPAELVAYISTIVTLVPGDVIATGTPGGVGHAHQPPRYLRPGSLLVTRIDGLGECRNRIV